MEKSRIKFISSWDDGGALDMRLADLLRKYHLPGIFYIPSNHSLTEKQLKNIAKDFEIGGHTVSHFQDLKLLDDKTLKREILLNKRYLELITGREIDKFCYPRGRYNDRVIEMVKECGYKSGRTTVVLKINNSNGSPYREPTTIHVYQRNEYLGQSWDRMARLYSENASHKDCFFHIWGHSKEINRGSNWVKLEAFFKWLVKNYQIEV